MPTTSRAGRGGRRGRGCGPTWARDRFPPVDGADGARRRAARPPHAAPARRARRDPGADRGGPSRGAGAGRPPAGDAPRHPAGQQARDRRRPAAALKVTGGHVRLPSSTADQWRERNPWLAFEDGFRLVRGFVQRLEGGAIGPLQARLGEDLRSLGEGTATAVLARREPLGRARAARRSVAPPDRAARQAPRIRLVLGQPPVRPGLERLALAYHAHRVGARPRGGVPPADRRPGREQPAGAVELAGRLARPVPRRRRAGDGPRRPGRPARRRRPRGARRGRPRRGVGRLPARRAPGSPTATTRLGGSSSSSRPARPCRPGRGRGRTSACRPSPAAPATRTSCRARACSPRPERFDQRPFSAAEAARTVTDAAVETLRARGEPARYERLFGEILVGLDRAGQLRRSRGRPAPSTRPATVPRPALDDRADRPGASRAARRPPPPPASDGATASPAAASAAIGGASARGGCERDRPRSAAEADGATDPVERLLGADPGRAHQARPAAARRDRARSLVARRPRRTRTRRPPAARRPRRVGRVQPPLDRGPAVRGGVLRAHRHAVHRP